MQYVLLTVINDEGIITGVDWFINNKKPKIPFILKYKGAAIQQCVFAEEECKSFYALISLYKPEIIKPLNIFNRNRREHFNGYN